MACRRFDVMRNDQIIISSRLAADLLHVMYIKDKHMLVFNLIYDCRRLGVLQ
jgi:hypothetical protein